MPSHKTSTKKVKSKDQMPDCYEDCIASFIDVLGFRNLLKRPASDVLQILNILRKFSTPDGERSSRRRDRSRNVSRAFAESVSDAVVRIRVFETKHRDGAFFHELLDLLHMQIDCINNGVLIRAGVAIGKAHVGADGKGPIFGEAVVRAFEIESGEAIFPRIVIDEAAYDTFLTDDRLISENNDHEEERSHVDKMLRVGEDGTRYIDYLRAAIGELDEEIQYYTFLGSHAQLIREGLAEAGSDSRIRRKLVWLAFYHNQVIGELLLEFSHDEVASAFEKYWDVNPIALLSALKVSN